MRAAQNARDHDDEDHDDDGAPTVTTSHWRGVCVCVCSAIVLAYIICPMSMCHVRPIVCVPPGPSNYSGHLHIRVRLRSLVLLSPGTGLKLWPEWAQDGMRCNRARNDTDPLGHYVVHTIIRHKRRLARVSSTEPPMPVGPNFVKGTVEPVVVSARLKKPDFPITLTACFSYFQRHEI